MLHYNMWKLRILIILIGNTDIFFMIYLIFALILYYITMLYIHVQPCVLNVDTCIIYPIVTPKVLPSSSETVRAHLQCDIHGDVYEIKRGYSHINKLALINGFWRKKIIDYNGI